MTKEDIILVFLTIWVAKIQKCSASIFQWAKSYGFAKSMCQGNYHCNLSLTSSKAKWVGPLIWNWFELWKKNKMSHFDKNVFITEIWKYHFNIYLFWVAKINHDSLVFFHCATFGKTAKCFDVHLQVSANRGENVWDMKRS